MWDTLCSSSTHNDFKCKSEYLPCPSSWKIYSQSGWCWIIAVAVLWCTVQPEPPCLSVGVDSIADDSYVSAYAFASWTCNAPIICTKRSKAFCIHSPIEYVRVLEKSGGALILALLAVSFIAREGGEGIWVGWSFWKFRMIINMRIYSWYPIPIYGLGLPCQTL